ncbi:MAG: hypothetical protein KF819_07545 [Labilithrix sp.]|nr:hypothetical protein [Labilithrix sp.]
MKTLFLGSLIVACALFGCSSSTQGTGGNSSGNNASGGTTSLDGSYSGSYAGDDTGPVRMTISGDDIDVVVKVGAQEYPASGKVTSGGKVTVGIGAGNGVTVTFDGSFANGSGSGTWKSSIATKGTWSVSK